ncbi:MAG: hypothetical protein LQ348_007597 [Seirophora lacunosa]|nr:MAG: hypothetical protein LQ344_006183 [Seirophora lacunosa]KAI4167839.1 MAG: hypothetical protein LQ348_007597 [Seirophora lacunosa]
MSGELVEPIQEPTTISNGVTKRPVNLQQNPAANDNLDSSTSANSPVASTFLDSSSTTAQASPTQGASDLSSHREQPTIIVAPAQTDVVQESNPEAGTTLQPRSPTDPGGASGGQHPIELEKIGKRASKGSIKVSSRRGSAESRKLSKEDKTAAPVTSSDQKGIDLASSENAERPRKKGLSRFFSALNCCSPSKDANASESNPAVPAKKAKTLQANRARQPAPVTKPNASAGESSKTESKEAIEDNIAGPPYSELTPAAKPKIIESPKKPTPIVEKSPPAGDDVPSAEPKVMPAQPSPTDQPLPPLPPDNKDPAATSYETYNEKPTAPGADEIVETPVPPTAVVAEEGISKEEMTINDRTPQQEARDIEMPDAPPVPPVPEQQAVPQETSIPIPTQTSLPPPPPISSPVRPSTSERRASNGAATKEQPKWLLPPMTDRFRGKKCLVLDLDETLVHSSFKILHQADFTIPVEIEGQYHNVYVIKRPGVDQFMKRVGELYEVVVFTASVSKYGDPLLDQLDIHNVVHHRLFRESCYNHQGNYVKDLSQVGRDLRETIIIDNSPTSYIFHPQHAVPISSWFSDAHDNELLDLIPVLEDLAGPRVRDVSLVLDVGL